jgi:23S rRNA maturation-related 3'-5' exoribonuclease YhaM
MLEYEKNLTTSRRIELFEGLVGDVLPKEFKKWLIQNGFFTQPASTKYHGAYEGGLFDHSYEVAQVLLDMTDRLNLKWTRPESPYIIGLLHDLCKVDNYITIVDEPGETMMGTDEVKGREIHFEYNPNTILKGHGEKSVMLLSQFMTLTEEEILCIRFHMGAYEGQEQWENYDKAIKKYENVLFTHTADMYASKVKGM